MVCNNSSIHHDRNCPDYNNNNNNLKGASSSAAAFQQKATKIAFPPTELLLISKSLEIAKFYITRNSEQFQQPQEILSKVEKALNIISKQIPTNQSLKGGSSNICPNTKKEHLKELLKIMVR